MRDIGKLLASTAIAMEEKLRENSELKGDWKGMSFQELMRLADQESLEFKLALYCFEHKLCDRMKALKEMRREAADNCNFYGMIIEKCDEIIKEGKK